MKWRFYGCKDFQKWGKMCLRVVVRTRARARSRCLPAGPWSNISPEVTRTAVAVCRYPHGGNCPERRVCCQSSECTTYRNCDVRARERRREREGRERGRGGREGVCRQTKVRYQLLKAGQTNSVERPIEGRERVGGRGGGWRLPRRCRRWRWYRWVRLSSAEPATDPVAPAVIQCSLDRADRGWIAHILRMRLRYQ